MPARSSVSDADFDDAICRYLKGELRLMAAAKLVHVSAGRLREEMAKRGVSVRTPSEGQALRHVRDADSEWKRNFTASSRANRETWINSAENRERMSALGKESSARNRGKESSEEKLAARALSHERALLKVSPVAVEFNRMLTERGLTTEMEKAAGRYNIDIAVGPIAVEVHRYSFNPLGPTRFRERKRTRYLCDRGWTVCYIWVRPTDGFLLSASAAHQVVTLTELVERTPSAIGEYWVIRGSGELVSRGRGDSDELA